MTIHTYLCIGCPLGCRLEVEADAEHAIVEIRGFDCKRGKEYAQQEHTDPRRLVTGTVAIQGGRWARLPVKTTQAVPKGAVLRVAAALHGLTVQAPVAMGDCLARNIAGTGADLIATRAMPAAG